MGTFVKKLVSRKLWVAVGGMVTGAVSGNPLLSAITAVVYIAAQGVVDALDARRGEADSDAARQ